MTNSRLTDPEVLETRLPVRLDEFRIRRGSGGAGKHRGGDGAVRRVRFLEAMRAQILANRRRVPPRGLAGGGDAEPGRNRVERADGSIEELPATAAVDMEPGDSFVIETPGGGGYGPARPLRRPSCRLDEPLARRMARIALGHVGREYPNLPGHVLYGDEDAQPPRVLHPAFFGSYDWHSCVHTWWTLLTLRRLFPRMPEAAGIAELADATFTPEKIAGEVAYLLRPAGATFQRPYGWAWLLTLHREAARHADRPWSELLAPLAGTIAARWPDYLAVLTYPIRAGTHGNSAFAVTLSLAWADRFDPALAARMRARAREWFAADRDSPAVEPGGDEFLSPTLTQALCLARCLPPGEAEGWLAAFLPRLGAREPATLFTPARVSDRADFKIAHLDGLNLSRAWCWRGLVPCLSGDAREAARDAAEAHLAAAMSHLTDAYAGEHWLASFALLALLEGAPE